MVNIICICKLYGIYNKAHKSKWKANFAWKSGTLFSIKNFSRSKTLTNMYTKRTYEKKYLGLNLEFSYSWKKNTENCTHPFEFGPFWSYFAHEC